MKFKNYINSYTKDNRIFSKEEIADMTVREAFKNKKGIISQNRQIEVPSNSELRGSSNVIWVNAYTRDDGTPVRGHWRSIHITGGIAGDTDPVIIEKNPKEPYDMTKQQNNLPEEGDVGEESSPFGILVDLAVMLSKIFFKDSKVSEYIEAFAPVIKTLGGKLLGDDEEDDVDPYNETQPDESTNVPSNNTPNGEPTGGASEVNIEPTYKDYTTGEPVVDVSMPEKVQKLMYPDEIAGVKRGEPKTFLQMMQQGVNPKYMSEEDINDEYSNNCQSCNVACELIIRGYDIEANSWNNYAAKELAKIENSAYLDPKTGKKCVPQKIDIGNVDCYEFLNQTVKKGERYEFSFHTTPEDGKYSDTKSHTVFISRLDDGKLIIYDGQDGSIAYDVKQVKLYINSEINVHNTVFCPRILRVDNKLLNPYYINSVVRARHKHH